MFTFFGLFADPVGDLARQIPDVWPDTRPVRMEQPISAIAVRFSKRRSFRLEDIPEPIIRGTEELSARNTAARFLLLCTECYGGPCDNWGWIFEAGKIVFQADGDGALRRLIRYFGVDLGPGEFFDPLSRDFPWN
jgi:hypothetical protein